MNINILIVDDEAYCAEKLIGDIDWDSLGVHKVYSAYSANQAMKVLEAEPIQLLVCDIEMPGGSGLDLIEWINEGSRLINFSIECLILTCHPEYAYMRKAMQLGCSDYLLKPFRRESMVEALTSLIQKIKAKEKDTHLPSEQTHQILWIQVYRLLIQKIKAKEKDTQRPYKTEGKGIGEYSEPDTVIEPDTEEHIRTKVIPYIQQHIATPISVTEIAEAVNLNPQYLMRLFRRQMGCSVIQYVTKYKMELAKDMLIHTGASNPEISEKLGYLNPSYFLRVFKENEGMTPGAFRKKYNIYKN